MFFTGEAKPEKFADVNTIYEARKDLNELLSSLKKESEVAIKWFRDNNMTVNFKTFQAIIVNKQNKSNHNQKKNLRNQLHF